jgi:hypothetical protein
MGRAAEFSLRLSMPWCVAAWKTGNRVTLTHALLVLLISSQVTLTLTFLSIKQPIETTAPAALVRGSMENNP